MVDERTQLVGVLGHPVGHSLSPAMHNAAFDALGIDGRYVPLSVAPDNLAAAVRGLVALGFRGANVTAPHKEAVVGMVDVLAPEAHAIGAVNVLVIQGEDGRAPRIEGHNTDGQGFARALSGSGFDGAGEWAVVMGAGGAARAVVHALLGCSVSGISVLSRDPRRAETLARQLSSHGAATLRPGRMTPETIVRECAGASLLVNATPLGMTPRPETSAWPRRVPMPAEMTVVDLVYRPLETQLLRQARAAGLVTVGGLEMLLEQGALSFALWTRRTPPVSVMRAACHRALGRVA